MTRQPGEANIPVLTDAIASASAPRPPLVERDAIVAELQTKLAARTFALANEILRDALAELEAGVFERVGARLRRDLPELIDATLREHLPEEHEPRE